MIILLMIINITNNHNIINDYNINDNYNHYSQIIFHIKIGYLLCDDFVDLIEA